VLLIGASIVRCINHCRAQLFISSICCHDPEAVLRSWIISPGLALGRNLHKSDRLEVPATEGAGLIAIFDPRRDAWSNHFEWDEYRLAGKTEKGRATIAALHLNHERRIKIRQAEKMFALFPPE
jgi:hypothetical protein